jgi:NADH:ubiquinone oxidoreductase subunit F (NADH-binding)
VSRGFLLPAEELTHEDHVARGGGVALERASLIGPAAVAAEVRAAGLRGRGGAGFPTGIKWQGMQEEELPRYLVCNAAEGEPGTFKDRLLMRRDPYQLIEGVAIAALAIGADAAFIATKASFAREIARLERAMAEMSGADGVGEIPIGLVAGPDAYLFGEEKALLEVTAGRDPMPTLYPPYVRGLFAEGTASHPTVVNNVETLSNVPHILRNGAEWFRSHGTEDTPGTMVFTVSGDVVREAVVELPMGTPLSELVFGVAEGPVPGRSLRAVVSGVSNPPLTADLLPTPMDFGSMRRVGSGLGSGGFMVYDDTACIARVAATLSGFLADESCGQCPPCKLGTEALRDRFAALAEGGARPGTLEEIAAWVTRVTDANRCGLGGGQAALAGGFVSAFGEDLAAHLDGPCGRERSETLPALTDYDEASGRFTRKAG